MSVEEIHVGDVGTIFEVTLKDGDDAVDISAATTKQLIFRTPDGKTVVEHDAEFVTTGVDGKIKYTTVADDLSVEGVWKIQAYIVLADGAWRSSVEEFQVYANLGDDGA